MVEAVEAVGLPQLDGPAPDFIAQTTQGTLALEDYKGRWLLLFSHPADFTPVCTTEFIAFTEIYGELQKRNVDLLGLSIDSVYSHLAWVRNIEEKMGVKVPFPIIADLDKTVATVYGMVQPGSKDEASRCVFFIDPDQIVRAMIYYPLSCGRNTQEVLRVIDALQTTDRHNVATPANWRPGDDVILPAPVTQEGVEERLSGGYDCEDWYYCKRKL